MPYEKNYLYISSCCFHTHAACLKDGKQVLQGAPIVLSQEHRFITSLVLYIFSIIEGSEDRVMCVVTCLRAGRSEVVIPTSGKKFFFVSKASKPALGPTHSHILWVPRQLLKMCGSLLLFPHTPLCRANGEL